MWRCPIATRRAPRFDAPPARGAVLGAIVEEFGLDVLRPVSTPRGLGLPVSSVVLHDPDDALTAETLDLILVVRNRVSRSAASAVLAEAGRIGASAVAVKAEPSALDELAAVADDAAVALLDVNPAITWTQLYDLAKMLAARPSTERFGDLFTLADAVASMVGGPVTVEDHASRVLAYSNLGHPIDEPRKQTILGRRVPDEWVQIHREQGVFERLWTSDDVVRLPPTPEARARIAIGVHAGGEYLGSLWVAEGNQPLDVAAEEALREAGRLAALHLVRHRARDALEGGLRGEILASLLSGRVTAEVAADQLSLDADERCGVIGCRLSGQDGEPDRAVLLERVAGVVAMLASTFRVRTAHVAMGGTVYVLLPVDADGSGVRRFAERLAAAAAERLRTSAHIGIGSAVDGLRDVPTSRAEADAVLDAIAPDPGSRVAAVEEVGTQVALSELRRIGRRNALLRSRAVERLVSSDRRRNTGYVRSLRAWIEHHGNVPAAAVAIGIHANTLRYRLERIKEIVGVDLDDPDERFAVELHLRIEGSS